MYPKANDFSTVCKEKNQTDLKTSCWFRSSIQRITKLEGKIQNGLRLMISTATVPRELSPATWVKVIKEKYVFSLSEETNYHSWGFRKLIQSFDLEIGSRIMLDCLSSFPKEQGEIPPQMKQRELCLLQDNWTSRKRHAPALKVAMQTSESLKLLIYCQLY